MYHFVGIAAILGMDWLSRIYAIIDYKKRKVYLSLGSEEKGKQLLFYGKKLKIIHVSFLILKQLNIFNKDVKDS